MRARSLIWGLLCLLCVAGAWLLWRGKGGSPIRPQPVATAPVVPPLPHAASAASVHGILKTNVLQISKAEWGTNRLAGRLGNTAKPIGQLVDDSHAILLANALIDTRLPLNFVFPKNLQPQGDPGAYIVQARGPVNIAFRALLAQSGAAIVSYIPNDAYLVRAPASVAGALGANSLVQAVIPYEPYYKIQSSLLYPAVNQMQLPDGKALNLGLFADNARATISEIEKLGGQVLGTDHSPFGPVVRVVPPKNWTVVATLPGVQIVEPFYSRATANDLSRAANGVAADTLTATNYLGLTGTNIIVEVNDTGIDANHPDLTAGGFYNRPTGVIGDAPQSLVDTYGHGTHVAGIIAGDGEESTTVTNAPGSILPGGTGTNYQFRGMAPGATLYSVGGVEGGGDTNVITDQYFQQVPALTNALISNNSWVYEGDSFYDLAAASYDAAVRDALPTVTGSQPVLFVFAAGNAGNGDDGSDPGGGTADSIESPATAKNVITVGAIQENRNITNTVTTVTLNSDGTSTTNSGQPWAGMTSTDSRVAGFSSRGNVGIGTEGTYGRYKPDVVAPGTFILSTRSEQWDINSYFYQDPTNSLAQFYSGLIVQPDSVFASSFPNVPSNTVQTIIYVYPNADSPVPFPFLPIYAGLFSTAGYDFVGANNPLLIPGDPNAPANYLQQIISTEGLDPFLGGFNYAVSNATLSPISFDLETVLLTTNGTGDYFLVLSNLDQSIGTLNPGSTGPGPYYRYESGTSMAAADVSGVLALMQQFYANAYNATPSPAMLKAMLVNGAQVSGSAYDYQAQNSINYEGWGAVNLPESLPIGITNRLDVSCSAYVQDQNPTNALATGDSQTYNVALTSPQPLRVTLAWTDPPGDPAAAIKLVNNLVLVVTNLSDPANPAVYYGNDISAGTYNNAHATNTPPVFDTINNVQTVNLQQGMGTNFTVTVMGYRVNVNAVTAQTNNVVQDYALVISTGTTNSMTVTTTPASFVSNPTGDQLINYLSAANVNAPLLNQFVGANTPLLGTNTVVFSSTAPEGFGPNNWQVTVGMTNQWHFYVVTNTFGYSNAAFITFNPNAPDPDTLSVPRMGVFADTIGNATRDADVDLYVTTDPTITNLNPMAISNCVVGTQIGADVGPNFAGASLGRGTSEFVVDTNSQSRTPSVYYIGVKSEDQQAAEYGFISIFTQTPFSELKNGAQVVNGVPVPASIPDGSAKVPGKAYVFGLALFPMRVGMVTVSNYIYHQNFGDLIGTVTLNGSHADVLNNHDSFDNPNAPDLYPYSLLYDDSAGGGVPGSRPSDGPGSLVGYMGQQAIGVWMLTEVDNALTQTGSVYSYTLNIRPHQDPTAGAITNYVPGGSWVYDYIDVPPGSTVLTIYATNVTDTATPPVELFVKYGSEPTTNDYDAMVQLTPNGVITLGPVPPLASGRYYIGLLNPNPNSPTQEIHLYAVITTPSTPEQTIYNSTDTPKPILDDAVTTDSIYVTNYNYISSMDVALAVEHSRISDLVFHLISPSGTRALLMENRGGTDTNGAGGISFVVTNTVLTSDFNTVPPGDYAVSQPVGTSDWNVTGNQVTVQDDPANAYNGGTNLVALANGTLYTILNTTPGQTYTLKFAYRGPGIVGWWRGENDAFDSAYGDNATTVQSITYTNGQVGQAFNFDGVNSIVTAPASANLTVTNFTFEGWVYPDDNTTSRPIMEFGAAGVPVPVDLWVNNGGLNTVPGGLYSDTRTPTPASDLLVTAPAGSVPAHQWSHVALTVDTTSRTAHIYVNGVLRGTGTVPTAVDPQTFLPLNLGYRDVGSPDVFAGRRFAGLLDEMSVYNRALSLSELQAISSDGFNGYGKFDTNEFPVSPLLSVAEAQLKINNGATVISTNFFGNNTNWQSMTVSFTAKSDQTPVQIEGVEPGMLLGNVSAVSVITNYYYLVFTENTNLTTTPIKFAVPPFLPFSSTNVVSSNNFDTANAIDYISPTTLTVEGTNKWGVVSNQVSVVNDPGTADSGSGQFLALADGSVTNILPTIAGRTYILTFRYRGPGAVSLWQADSNANDSIGGNNGTPLNGANYAPGYVNGGQAFQFNGIDQKIDLGDPDSLKFTNSFSFDGWVYLRSYNNTYNLSQIIDRADDRSCLDPYNFGVLNTGQTRLHVESNMPGCGADCLASGFPTNQWKYVAGTFDGNSGTMTIYVNGVLAAQTVTSQRPFQNLDPTRNPGLAIGDEDGFSYNQAWDGWIDDLTAYGRALSASEVKAIYNQGSAGKFDTNAPSVATGLAEAQLTLDGAVQPAFYGNNSFWQTKTIIFTATQNGTPLQITGLEPGMLLDSFNLTVSPGEAYYLPEQSLDAFDGENAHGTWTLEVQDDRAGATNPAPMLQSWQLRFNFVTLGTNNYPALPLTLPQLPEQIAVAGQLFTVTNAAFGGTPPYTYALTSSVPFAPFPTIDTNGVITWTPTTNQAPAVYTFTNIVTDTSMATATDIFQVLVVLTNSLPAFPGAGGPGGTAIGGRGGDVYHVINLNDGGPGSLRYGITNTSGNRTIVFDVSGTINLKTNLVINNPYLTIAGQTAPGDGITIQGYTVSVQDTHDDVLRFLRCRPGDINSPVFQGDSFHFLGVTNSIADHISASWSINEVLSATYSTNITVQWSVIAQALNHSAHYANGGAPGFQVNGDGSLIRYGSGAVGFYHNLFADNYSYNPRLGDDIKLDFINNVVCNWGIFAGLTENDSVDNPSGFANFINYIGNYFIAGSNTIANPNFAFQGDVPFAGNTEIYQGTNYIDNNAGTNLLNGIDTGWGMFNGTFAQLSTPVVLPGIPVTFTNPPQAYEQVLAFAGDTMAGASASGTYLLRDSVDTNIVNGVRNKNGQIVDFVSSNRFSSAYLITNSETTYSGYANAGTYWQSQGITNFVGVNPWPVLDSAPQPLDSDGDGIPDYWEITLAALGNASMDPLVPNNNHVNPDGYTDLEHYINWLAAPHALTVSNTPVDVDLNAIVGRTGNWSFGVTNAVNGTVSLDTNGYTATFTPTNDFIGFASFDFNATNLVTSNYFDVTVSVMVSVTNIVNSSVPLTNSVPDTNSVPANSIVYYLVNVPANALFGTNQLLFASGPVNLWFSQSGFPTGTNIGDYNLLANSTIGSSVLSTTSMPTNIVPGGTYYLGVQNTGGTPVNFGLQVDFNLASPGVSNVITGPTITTTTVGGTNGILLTWFAPTNYLFQVQWATSLVPPIGWTTIPGVVLTNLSVPPPVGGIGEFQYFDDGSLTGGLGTLKFYRLVAYAPGTPIPPSLVISSVLAWPGGLQIKWNGLTNYTYDVAWTTNLALPRANWNTLSNLGPPTLTFTGGVFTFTDDGSLTGGTSAAKFFRVLLLP